MGKRYLGLFMLLLVVLASQETANKVDARTCESESYGFKGPCVSDHNCGLVCKNEGFTGGHCMGARHRCFCTKPC